MILEVLGQLTDALGKDSDLDFGRTGVALVGGVVSDDLGLDFFGDHRCYTPFKMLLYPVSRQRAERLPQ